MAPPVQPLLLASEALREDLAPLDPLASTGRRLGVLAAAGLALCGAALLFGVGTPQAIRGGLVSASAALVALALGLLPLSYQARAHGMGGLGLALMLSALAGEGPAAALILPRAGTAFPWELARLLAAALLPAALLLRAHYRAFPRARLLLGWGLTLALPFVIRSAYLVLLAPTWSERIAASSAIGSVLLALLGFMGSHTTAGGSLWAICLLGSLTLDIAARLFLPLEAAHAQLHLATAAGFLLSAGLGAFGLFQSLAHALAPDARRDIDDRRRRRGLGPPR